MFIKDGHPVALEDIIGWMILSGEDIADIRCFLVGLVTGDNWQNNHGDNSQCRGQDHAATDAVEDWDQRQTCLFMR